MARTRGSAGGETSLFAAMTSTRSPDVVVLDFVDEDSKFKEIADPKKDLWLSTVDGQVISFRNKICSLGAISSLSYFEWLPSQYLQYFL
jgi:hypothetical protein